MQRLYLLISGAVFALVAVGHLVRATSGWPLRVGEWDVPVWVSWVAVALAGSLSVWAQRLRRVAD